MADTGQPEDALASVRVEVGGRPDEDRRAPRIRPARRLLWFAPFLLVSVVQLVSNALDVEPVNTISHWLAMPVLMLPAWRLAPRRDALALRLLLLALAFCWMGDVAIGFRFELGLAGFLLAHVTYLALSVRAFRRRIFWPAYGTVPLLVLMLIVLAPLAGPLLVPVFTYAFVLTGMAIAMSRGNTLTTLGGALFFVSDGVLALSRFDAIVVPQPLSDVVIMSTYLGAQLAIVLGVHALLDRRTSPTEIDELTSGDAAYARGRSRRGHTAS